MIVNISVISDICGIAAFIVSLFVAAKVIQINNKINISSDNSNNQTAKGRGHDQTITNS